MLSLSTLLKTARVAFRDPLLDADDIEAMCASLLDQVSSCKLRPARSLTLLQGYLKAYIQQERGLLVLQRGEQMGFPPVSAVRMIGDEA